MNVKILEAIAKAIAPPLRELSARLDALEVLAGISPEQKTLADSYQGVWRWGDTHTRGQMVTDHGSLWMCLKNTGDRPGKSGHWRLISKHGKQPEVA